MHSIHSKHRQYASTGNHVFLQPEWCGTKPSAHQPMTLAQLLIPLAILFSVSLVFFGMSGGYYDTDAYDGNGTAH